MEYNLSDFMPKFEMCENCKRTFAVRDTESTTEIRCGECQVAFRLRGSDKPIGMTHQDWKWTRLFQERLNNGG